MAEATKPLAGEDLELAIAQKIRDRQARETANKAESQAIVRRNGEIAKINDELAAMRAAQRAGAPYVPGTTAGDARYAMPPAAAAPSQS